MKCPKCGKEMTQVSGSLYGKTYLCEDCGLYVKDVKKENVAVGDILMNLFNSISRDELIRAVGTIVVWGLGKLTVTKLIK